MSPHNFGSAHEFFSFHSLLSTTRSGLHDKVIEAHTQGDTSRKRPRSYKREQRQQGCSGAVEDSEKAGAKKGSRHQLWGSSNQTVTSVKWMADGEKFITGGQDGLVKVSDVTLSPLFEVPLGVPLRDRATRTSSEPKVLKLFRCCCATASQYLCVISQDKQQLCQGCSALVASLALRLAIADRNGHYCAASHET